MKGLIITILLFFTLSAQSQREQFYIMQGNYVDPCTGIPIVSDPDAQRFLCATKITDATTASAINQLVISLKDSLLWSLPFVAYYPMASDGILKTRSDQMAYNLRDTGLFKITWGSGVSFAATGVDFGSGNSTGTTWIIPNIHLSTSSTALSYYSRGTETGGFEFTSTSGTSTVQLRGRIDNGGNTDASMYNGTSTALNAPNGGTQGLFTWNRTAATGAGCVSIYKNGVQIATNNITAGSAPTNPLNLGSTGSSGQKECAFAAVTSGLTAAQARALSNVINAFNTALSRNVY